MLWALFVRCLRSEYVELTLRNAPRVIGGHHPVFVKFYSQGCGECFEWSGPFSEASTMFPDVTFGGVNCPEQDDLCEQFGIRKYPAVRFFSRNDRQGIPYDGLHTVDALCDFVAAQTNVTALPSRASRLVDLTPTTFPKYYTTGKCGLLLYYGAHCSECQHHLPQFGQLAFVFEGNPNISVAALSCERYAELCRQQGVGDLREERGVRPALHTFVDGQFAHYIGLKGLSSLVEHVNKKCGVDRRTDGLLGDTAGRIEAADAIAREFIDAFRQPELIEKTKKIPGAEFYVRMMERCMANGAEQLKKDAAAMKKNLDERKGSIATLDGIKKRYNVVMSFFPTHPTLPPNFRLNKPGAAGGEL